jgi:hypothetical protein
MATLHNQFKGLWLHVYPASGDRHAVSHGFFTHIDHVGITFLIEMGQFAHRSLVVQLGPADVS